MASPRTVRDFANLDEIKQALKEVGDDGLCDWRLTSYEASTTIPQNEDDELARLWVLKSYDILDTAQEPEFESITKEAKEYFKCPIAVVSLVDRRQWFKSIQGLEADQTPRSCAFCAHVVQRKETEGCLVVPDATKDFRFADNPLVVGGPKIRFYAGAPLKSPEGVTLGSICVIDFEPHPQGLTVEQKSRLHTFASEAVYNMITRL